MAEITRHFISRVYTVKDGKVLLIKGKTGNWLPPGGHIEMDELPDLRQTVPAYPRGRRRVAPAPSVGLEEGGQGHGDADDDYDDDDDGRLHGARFSFTVLNDFGKDWSIPDAGCQAE